MVWSENRFALFGIMLYRGTMLDVLAMRSVIGRSSSSHVLASAGDRNCGVSPWSISRFWRNSGAMAMSRISRCSLAMMSGGVPAGAHRPKVLLEKSPL